MRKSFLCVMTCLCLSASARGGRGDFFSRLFNKDPETQGIVPKTSPKRSNKPDDIALASEKSVLFLLYICGVFCGKSSLNSDDPPFSPDNCRVITPGDWAEKGETFPRNFHEVMTKALNMNGCDLSTGPSIRGLFNSRQGALEYVDLSNTQLTWDLLKSMGSAKKLRIIDLSKNPALSEEALAEFLKPANLDRAIAQAKSADKIAWAHSEDYVSPLQKQRKKRSDWSAKVDARLTTKTVFWDHLCVFFNKDDFPALKSVYMDGFTYGFVPENDFQRGVGGVESNIPASPVLGRTEAVNPQDLTLSF